MLMEYSTGVCPHLNSLLSNKNLWFQDWFISIPYKASDMWYNMRCSLKLSFSSPIASTISAALWFDALWNCLSVARRLQPQLERLWFDALWNCLSVAAALHGRRSELWFDALWNCLSVRPWAGFLPAALWFDALWNCLSVEPPISTTWLSCDLMLFEIVFQFPQNNSAKYSSCDLMLFEIVFQSYYTT